MSFIMSFFSFIFNLFGDKKRERVKDVDPADELVRAASYPPAFPNGWFNLCSSDAVKKGQVIEAHAFGHKFAVYRGEDGVVGVLDLYCPHLNANLADGCVKGNRLVCPFHGWEFEQDGRCTHIPYTENEIPEKAKTKSWTIQENWGLILVWYHGEGEEPSWNTDGYLPELEEFNYHGFTSDILRIHLQDFAENGADYAHFNFVHNLVTIPFTKNFVHLKHKTEITFGKDDEKHMAWFRDTAMLAKNKTGEIIKNAGGDAVVTYFGPGFLVFKLNSRLAKDVMILKTFTPLGPLKLRMDDHVYAPRGTNKMALKYILRESSAQFHDDILIWEKKSYVKNPILVQGDGPIMKMRRWYKQFYSEEVQLTDYS